MKATVTAAARSAILPGGVSFNFDSDQPWSARWYKVKQSLSALEDICRPGYNYQGNLPDKNAFESFFIDCFHMGDWLWNDPSIKLPPANLTETEIRDFISNDPSLRICAGMANTDKHRVRHSSKAITAKVTGVTPGPNGTKVLIEWSQQGTAHTEDALDLARRCVAAWEGYLLTNNLI